MKVMKVEVLKRLIAFLEVIAWEIAGVIVWVIGKARAWIYGEGRGLERIDYQYKRML